MDAFRIALPGYIVDQQGGHMKRLALFVALALSATVNAAPPPGNGPDRDYVLAGGRTSTDIFNVVAHSGPNGEAAFGHFQAKNVHGFTYDFDIEFDVTCLRVSGGLATIGGRTTKLVAPPPYNITDYPGVIVFVRDGSVTGTMSAISYEFPVTYIPASCPAPSDVYMIFPLLQGNINVHDE
jgi:hypothetical protein